MHHVSSDKYEDEEHIRRDILKTLISWGLSAMSYTLALKSRSSVLSAKYFPPIDISNGAWSIALTGLETYNSIPNITEVNNKLHLEVDGKEETVVIEPGAYDIDELNHVLKQLGNGIELRANINTLKTEIRTVNASINFGVEGSIGRLLGFTQGQVLKKDADNFYSSDQTVDILPVSTIQVECNITTNSYLNDELVHSIYGFFPSVGSGYKIIEKPTNAIYLPVTVQTVDYLELRIVDQNNRLVNFRGEEIIVRLHLKQDGGKV